MLKREYMLDSGSGSSRDFWNKGIRGSIIDHTHHLCFEPLSIFREEPCDDVKVIYVGFLLLEYELPLSLSN